MATQPWQQIQIKEEQLNCDLKEVFFRIRFYT